MREVRRAAREALSLRAEVGRLKRLLAAAGVDARKRSTIVSLRLEVETRRTRIGELEAELAKLRASRAVHAKARFGRKSERRERAGSDRPRGQQAGAAGHGRTPRPGLEKRAEVHNPAADERVCSDCGKPYVANGSDRSELIEVSVKAHTRVIERPRWRRGCDCAAAPPEVSAPPVARLFANTPYGTSVWARFLYERYACLRPLNRVADWLTGQGLAISAGTLADGARRLAPLFEPLSAAIPAHQREARLRQGDETAWRIQALGEAGGSSRAWLWIGVCEDAVHFHVDPSRSAAAAARLFGDAAPGTVLVCDRYSAYKKLAKDSAGLVTLAFCWAHVRRDFIKCAAGNEALAEWERRWTGRIALLYRLNGARLEHYDAGLGPDGQNRAFAAAHRELERECGRLFAAARRELDGLPDDARRGQAATFPVEPSRGVERVPRPAGRSHGQQFFRAHAQGGGHRQTSLLRLRQRGRSPVHGNDVLHGRHPGIERRGCPSLADRVACGVRGQRRMRAGRPLALAALVDGRGAPERVDGAGMTGAVECRYHGRDFTPGEMALLRALIAGPPALNRHALSKEFCRRVGWFKPDGGLKDMMARVTMLAMHKDGLITLPPPKWRQNRPGPIVFGPDTEPPPFPAPTTLDEVRPLDLRTVVRGTRAGKLWNEFVARHHYLGYTTLVGAQMRYAVHDRDGTPIAMLGFSTAAWKLAPRDNFIGWTPQLREKNLPLVVDNPRFLILPWIEIPNLGSHLLAIVRRRLPVDWAERYNTKPVLIETFVETPRYTGAVYRASGWVHVGTTRGRGRYDRQRQFDKPRKDIWLRPLRKDWKRILNR